MKNVILFSVLLFLGGAATIAQEQLSEKQLFFTEEIVFKVTINADLKKLFQNEVKGNYLDATISYQSGDSSFPGQPIRLAPRGEFRRKNCVIPSMKIDFTKTTARPFNKFKQVKMVTPCDYANHSEALVLKEYLVYKMYNMLTELSFRVRLIQLELADAGGGKKPMVRYAFLIEDVDDMAKRNKCREIQGAKFNTESTQRLQTTLVNLFQFMIGNTDWAIPVYHNIKLIQPLDTNKRSPVVVPYDFDFAGVVDAPYAVPDPVLGTSSVKERVYRGFPRTRAELQVAFDVLLAKKDSMYTLIKTFEPLSKRDRELMIDYLDEFYTIIKSESSIKAYFITGARDK